MRAVKETKTSDSNRLWASMCTSNNYINSSKKRTKNICYDKYVKANTSRFTSTDNVLHIVAR